MKTTRTTEFDDPEMTASAARGRSGLEFLRAIASGAAPQPPIGATLGFELVEAGEGFARFRCVPGRHLYNPMNQVHGGVACTLLDSALGCAVMTTLDERTAYATAQLSINMVRPMTASTGTVYAEARIVHRGKTLATAEGQLRDERGRLLAHGTTTCALMPRSQ